MDDYTLLTDGLNLMMLGMGFVFVFLTVLVLATSLMSWAIAKYEKSVGKLPEDGIPAPTAVLAHNHPKKSAQAPSDKAIIPILTAAIHTFRRNKKN